MLLAREFVSYLSRQIVRKLSPQVLETPNTAAVAEIIDHIISEELAVEDRLNEEVREILGQYADYMRREGVSYQEMFRKIKNTLIAQRKVSHALADALNTEQVPAYNIGGSRDIKSSPAFLPGCEIVEQTERSRSYSDRVQIIVGDTRMPARGGHNSACHVVWQVYCCPVER